MNIFLEVIAMMAVGAVALLTFGICGAASEDDDLEQERWCREWQERKKQKDQKRAERKKRRRKQMHEKRKHGRENDV